MLTGACARFLGVDFEAGKTPAPDERARVPVRAGTTTLVTFNYPIWL
jgi:hypothetical protein